MKKSNFLECFLVRFGSDFPFKFNEQIDTRIDAEQVMKTMKICENGFEIDTDFDSFRSGISWNFEFSEKGGCTKTI